LKPGNGGLKPGAFKLWVNWIQLVEPRHSVSFFTQFRSFHSVAVQVDPFESKL
jgi:hypothetical protein